MPFMIKVNRNTICCWLSEGANNFSLFAKVCHLCVGHGLSSNYKSGGFEIDKMKQGILGHIWTLAVAVRDLGVPVIYDDLQVWTEKVGLLSEAQPYIDKLVLANPPKEIDDFAGSVHRFW